MCFASGSHGRGAWRGRTSSADRAGRGYAKGEVAVDDLIRGFAVEQASVFRGELLEITVVLLILLEVVLFVVGVMK